MTTIYSHFPYTRDKDAGAKLSFNYQFFDERWSRHRTVTSLDWSTQVLTACAIIIKFIFNCIQQNRLTIFPQGIQLFNKYMLLKPCCLISSSLSPTPPPPKRGIFVDSMGMASWQFCTSVHDPFKGFQT